jgi:hypothetical protein
VTVLRRIPVGDLLLVSGDLVVYGYTDVTRVLYIRQKLSVRYKFFLKEWFLDQRLGMPYYRDVFVKSPNIALIRSLFKRVTTTCPGVLDVPAFSLAYDDSARELRFGFQAVVDGGVLVVTPEDEDFLVAA